MKTTEIDKLHEQVSKEFRGYFDRKEQLEKQIRDARLKLEGKDDEITDQEQQGFFDKVSNLLKTRNDYETELRSAVEELDRINSLIREKKEQRSRDILTAVNRAIDADKENSKRERPDQIRQEVAEKMNEVQDLVREFESLSKEFANHEVATRTKFNKYMTNNHQSANRLVNYGFYQDFQNHGISEGLITRMKREV